MKPVKTLGLTLLAAIAAMAVISVSSAMASSTALCTEDPGGACATTVGHTHETIIEPVVIWTNPIIIACKERLILSSTKSANLGAPLILEGTSTYGSCSNGCEVKEVNGPSVIEVLKTGHETASVTGEGEINVHCGFFINCTYNGEGLVGTAKGPLLSSAANGEVSIQEQELNRVSGFCPEFASLTSVTTPLTATYIGS